MSESRMSDRELFELNQKAAVQNYNVEPRLDYRTVSGINGPLVVLDNVASLERGMQYIIPRGEAGSVILTSQDGHVPQSFNRKCEVITVGEMSDDEATQLMLSEFDLSPEAAGKEVVQLSLQIVNRLDKLPLAIDMAGARISSDVGDGISVTEAMHQYLACSRSSLINIETTRT